MKKTLAILSYILLILIGFILFQCSGFNKSKDSPFIVKADLFNQEEINTLSLKFPKGIETVTIFMPTGSTDRFSNGAVMTKFKGYYYCQWQSSAKGEDSEDTWVAYSRSLDGKQWTEPKVLVNSLDKGYCTSGGWWKSADTLVAFINEWPYKVNPKGGFTYYKTSLDGVNWSQKKPVLMADGSVLNGIIEQDPHSLPSGRLICAAHFQPGLIVTPIYTDNPLGIDGWEKATFVNSAINKNVSREIEPSIFLHEDDGVVMVFRDQNGTHFSMASVSENEGENWSIPVLTNMPDSRSKQCAGNLLDGTAYLINNPVNNKKRFPLVVTLSKSGKTFNTAYLIRAGGKNMQPQRFEGKYKRPGYHYPKSFVSDSCLFVSYTTNKEDVEYTKIPLRSLVVNSK